MNSLKVSKKTSSWFTSRFLLLHLPFLFLLLFAVLSLIFNESYDLVLREKKIVNVNLIGNEHGLPFKNDVNIELLSFVKEEGGGDSKKRQNYTSHLRVNKELKSISVNKPLSVDRYRFYQMDWQLHIRNIRFLINGTEKTLKSLINDGYALNDNFTLFVFPENIEDETLLYKWLIFDAKNKPYSEGTFKGLSLQTNGLELSLLNAKTKIELVSEDFGYSSVILVTWTPLQHYLFFSAMVFLLGQALVFVPMAWKYWKRRGHVSYS